MSIWELLVEGLISEDEVTVSDEDMAWYIEATYVDPAERVDC